MKLNIETCQFARLKKPEMERNEFLSLLIHYSSQVIILAYLGSNAYKGLLATPVYYSKNQHLFLS